jgi:hypothetical protein
MPRKVLSKQDVAASSGIPETQLYAVPCPRCGALVGKPCVRGVGRWSTPHLARLIVVKKRVVGAYKGPA